MKDGQAGNEPRPLGAAKVESFGTALKAAIRAEFRTNKDFAGVLSVSEGRISQLVNGPEDVNPATLERVLMGFSSPMLQERVHTAWVQEFAPLPEPRRDELSAERVVAIVKELWTNGRPLRALRIAESQRSITTDEALWQELSGLVVLINLRLSRTAHALKVIERMEQRAKASGSRGDLLTALWMRTMALRNVGGISLQQLDDAHQRAVEVATSWQPSGSGRANWEVKKMELHRDFTLNVLATHDRKPLADSALQTALRSAEKAVEISEGNVGISLGLEVRSRIELALGHHFAAEDTLSEAFRIGRKTFELWEKTRLTRAKIALARGERDRAIDLLELTAEQCFESQNLHHYGVANNLLARILSGG